ncbi:MAG: geranylgeranyl reductase family protein [Deltaproteobacteria bacterium]|nr:geranylgeranyl reductase family protein [Deltaproteobacteria bacterium]
MPEVDVLIAGAGPAGSSAAYFLARAGLRPLLLDQSRFPRDKVCGDGLTPRSTRMIERLGLREKIEGKYRRITSVRMISPFGTLAELEMPKECFGGQGFVVPRYELDSMLLQNALDAGARLQSGCRVTGVRREDGKIICTAEGGDEYAAKVLVAADGANSIIRRKLKLDKRTAKHGAWAIRAYYSGVAPDSAGAFEISWDKQLLPAYGWLFPLEGGRANVGLGIREDYLKESGRKLPDLFDDFVKLNPRMQVELKNATCEGKPRGHYLPFGSYYDPFTADRVIFAGDAAGFIHPLTGEGIEYALESGEAAAGMILTVHGAGGNYTKKELDPYGKECMRRFGHTMSMGYRMQRMFRFPRLVERSMKLAVENEEIRNQFASVLIGDGRGLPLSLYRKVILGF